jgi:hypothetical protein
MRKKCRLLALEHDAGWMNCMRRPCPDWKQSKTLNPTLATLHKWSEALGRKLDADLSAV